MYLSWSEYYLNSKKANTKSLNVRPIKPHTHANLLKFVCTISVHFYVNVVCAGESGYRCQSLSVLRPFHQPGFYFLFSLLTFDVNFSFFFCPTDWKHVGYREWESATETWWSFLWSNTVPYLSCQAQIPLHCLISMVGPIIGLTAWNVWNKLVLV